MPPPLQYLSIFINSSCFLTIFHLSSYWKEELNTFFLVYLLHWKNQIYHVWFWESLKIAPILPCVFKKFASVPLSPSLRNSYLFHELNFLVLKNDDNSIYLEKILEWVSQDCQDVSHYLRKGRSLPTVFPTISDCCSLSS